MASHGKPYSLYKRNRIYYVRFKLPDNRWGTAKSTGETSKSKAERWAFDYLSAGKVVITVKDSGPLSGHSALARRIVIDHKHYAIHLVSQINGSMEYYFFLKLNSPRSFIYLKSLIL